MIMASYTVLRRKYHHSMMSFHQFTQQEDSQFLRKLWALLTFTYYKKKTYLDGTNHSKTGENGYQPSLERDKSQEDTFIHNTKIKDILLHNLKELDIFKNKNRKMVTKEELVKKLVLVKKKLKKDRKQYLRFQIQDVSQNKTSKIIKLLMYILFIFVFIEFAKELNNVEDVFYINNGITSVIDSKSHHQREKLTYFYETGNQSTQSDESIRLGQTFNIFEVKTLHEIKKFFKETLQFFKEKNIEGQDIRINEFTEVMDWKAIRYAVKQLKLPQNFLDPETEERFKNTNFNIENANNHLLLRIFVFPPQKRIFNYINNSYTTNNDNYFRNDLGKINKDFSASLTMDIL
jgi:hypothetical protein